VARRAELVGFVHEEQRERRRDGVADAGEQSDHRVEAETHIEAGDRHCRIEQPGERVQALDPRLT
jgi:hypothetical protein